MTDAERRTRERFETHRQAFRHNQPLRALYARWYRLVAHALPPLALGRWIELGSGPGLVREFIADLELSDVVQAPWHQHKFSAQDLPFASGALGALVMFDVLHHLPAPARFFAEAQRVLVSGGRVVLCEPFVGPLSYPVYRFLHEEGLDAAVDPFLAASRPDKDPFEGNQIVPTLIFGKRRAEFASRFPGLQILSVQRMAGPSYPATGGFSRPPFLPGIAWRALLAAEDLLPEAVFGLIGFRMFVVIEKR